MDRFELLRIAELAGLGAPEDAAERDAFLRAREMLRAFAAEVTRRPAARTRGAPAAQAACPLRGDEPRTGLPKDAVFGIAPESGERLVQVPRVL